jgi:hypothetical protein
MDEAETLCKIVLSGQTWHFGALSGIVMIYAGSRDSQVLVCGRHPHSYLCAVGYESSPLGWVNMRSARLWNHFTRLKTESSGFWQSLTNIRRQQETTVNTTTTMTMPGNKQCTFHWAEAGPWFPSVRDELSCCCGLAIQTSEPTQTLPQSLSLLLLQ